MIAGMIAEACAAFEQSQLLEPAVTTLVALASCRERLGQLATALELILEVERQTRSLDTAEATQLHKLATDRKAKLEPRVSKLTVRVPDTSKRAGLEILRDQDRLPAEAWNRALPIDGGTYTITARVEGAQEWSTRVTLAAEADTVTVSLSESHSGVAHGRHPYNDVTHRVRRSAS